MAQPTEATANIVRPAWDHRLSAEAVRRAARKELADGKAPRKALMVSWAPSMLVARSGDGGNGGQIRPPRAEPGSPGTEQDEEETGEELAWGIGYPSRGLGRVKRQVLSLSVLAGAIRCILPDALLSGVAPEQPEPGKPSEQGEGIAGALRPACRQGQG